MAVIPANPPSATAWIGGLALLVLLALLAVGRCALGTRLDSFTVDEPWHIVAGTAYIRGGDRHLNPEHPPLVMLWTGTWMPDDFRLDTEPELQEKEKEPEREWVERTMFLDNDAARAQRGAAPAATATSPMRATTWASVSARSRSSTTV